jgi:hypothetical protein
MWSLLPKVVYRLCVSIIRPSITFASRVWRLGCQAASSKKQLSRLQRLASLGITGAMHITLTSAVEALTCFQPLDLVVESEARARASTGFSKQSIKRKIQCWLDKQHVTPWQDLAGTQRQDRELILGPHTAAKPMLLSFDRTKSRLVIGLLTEHNTLRRHLHVMGLTDSLLCRKCGAEEETSAHVLCEYEALVTLRHTYRGSFFLNPADIRGLSLGGAAIWNFIKRAGLSWLGPS